MWLYFLNFTYTKIWISYNVHVSQVLLFFDFFFSQLLEPQLFMAPNVEGQIWLKGHSLPSPP